MGLASDLHNFSQNVAVSKALYAGNRYLLEINIVLELHIFGVNA